MRPFHCQENANHLVVCSWKDTYSVAPYVYSRSHWKRWEDRKYIEATEIKCQCLSVLVARSPRVHRMRNATWQQIFHSSRCRRTVPWKSDVSVAATLNGKISHLFSSAPMRSKGTLFPFKRVNPDKRQDFVKHLNIQNNVEFTFRNAILCGLCHIF